MIIPYYYTEEQLFKILKRNRIDLTTGIENCKLYMSMNGWSISKKRRVEKNSLIMYGGVIKKIIDFNGWEVHIQKRGKTIAALMEDEKNAILVCIIEAIKKNY
jgi:hypothetical protein